MALMGVVAGIVWDEYREAYSLENLTRILTGDTKADLELKMHAAIVCLHWTSRSSTETLITLRRHKEIADFLRTQKIELDVFVSDEKRREKVVASTYPFRNKTIDLETASADILTRLIVSSDSFLNGNPPILYFAYELRTTETFKPKGVSNVGKRKVPVHPFFPVGKRR